MKAITLTDDIIHAVHVVVDEDISSSSDDTWHRDWQRDEQTCAASWWWWWWWWFAVIAAWLVLRPRRRHGLCNTQIHLPRFILRNSAFHSSF